MGRDDQVMFRQPEAGSWPKVLDRPPLAITGEIDGMRTREFLDALAEAEKADGDLVLQVTTLGGDAEMARRIVLEVDLARKRSGKRFLFLGKTVVYSAGTTIMSAFPREDRWLTRDAVLLIHCRHLEKKIEISGPMRASLPEIDAVRAQIENGLKLEKQNFERLIAGSDVSFDEIWDKSERNWYLTADEALERGLVAGIMG